MTSGAPRIGLDFDNTIACYDTAFFEVARAQGLMPDGPTLTKAEVKDMICRKRGGPEWTRLQGQVYGPQISRAHVFEGVPEFIERAAELGWEVYVVSHKTPVPVLGEPFDLHQAARSWLEDQGLFSRGLRMDRTFFEPTRESKIERLTALGCAIFVDDLPEVFLEPTFPTDIGRWLHGSQTGPWRHFVDWSEPTAWLEAL